jgi:probable phosphoglycerate mutase
MIDRATMPPRVFFVRHGQTVWSQSGQHTGETDIPLTAHGEQQARALRPSIAAISFSEVLASARARATCELSGASANPKIDTDLAEWDYGDYEGRRSADICKIRPGWNLFRDGCPNGEAPAEIGARAHRLIARLRTMKGDVALFSHGQFGSVLGVRWIGLDVVEGRYFSIGPASLSVFSYDPDHPEVAVLARWNMPASWDAQSAS